MPFSISDGMVLLECKSPSCPLAWRALLALCHLWVGDMEFLLWKLSTEIGTDSRWRTQGPWETIWTLCYECTGRSHLPPRLPSSAPTPAVTSALSNHTELQRGSEHGLCLASDSGSALRLLGTCYLTSAYLSLLLSNMGIIVVAIS